MRIIRIGGIAGALLASALGVVRAEDNGWPEAIEDNSFLIEEAFNQDPGVVQWIFGFQYLRPGDIWACSFTNEWPVPGQTHQLSFAVPYSTGGGGAAAGWGDIAVNYRFQALDGGERGWWFAPRASLLTPSGDWRNGLGSGVWGLQIGLPFSRRVSPQLAVHLNAGAQLLPRSRALDDAGREIRADAWGLSQGASVIWLASPRFNLMLEAVASQNRATVGENRTVRSSVALVSPGFRYAFNLPAGQLVLGAAIPVGLTRSSPDPGVFLYLSWEAPVWQPSR